MSREPHGFLSRFPAYPAAPKPRSAASDSAKTAANDIRRRIAQAFDWLIARDDKDERRQVAFLAIAALVLVLMIAGVKPEGMLK